VTILPTLYEQLFCMEVFCNTLCAYCLDLDFSRQEIGVKAACKMLTNCRKVDSENLVDIEHKSGIGDKSDNLIVNDSDANLVIFCRTLEKAFRKII